MQGLLRGDAQGLEGHAKGLGLGLHEARLVGEAKGLEDVQALPLQVLPEEAARGHAGVGDDGQGVLLGEVLQDLHPGEGLEGGEEGAFLQAPCGEGDEPGVVGGAEEGEDPGHPFVDGHVLPRLPGLLKGQGGLAVGLPHLGLVHGVPRLGEGVQKDLVPGGHDLFQKRLPLGEEGAPEVKGDGFGFHRATSLTSPRKKGSPSVLPKTSSTALSGWGIMPRTLPFSLTMPAMSWRLPLGL